jgi:hypothetical protein
VFYCYYQDLLSAAQLMTALQCRATCKTIGLGSSWRNSLPFRYHEQRGMDEVRNYLQNNHSVQPTVLTEGDMNKVRVFNEQMKTLGLHGIPSWATLSYTHWDHGALTRNILARELWMERYPGAAVVLLALQFIEMCMSEMDRMQAFELEPFVTQFCYLLQTPSDKGLPNTQQMPPVVFLNQVLRLMYEVVATNTDRLVDTAHESMLNLQFRASLIPTTPTVAVYANALDNLIGDLFCMFNRVHMDNDSIFAIWKILQVLNTLLFPDELNS